MVTHATPLPHRKGKNRSTALVKGASQASLYTDYPTLHHIIQPLTPWKYENKFLFEKRWTYNTGDGLSSFFCV